MTRLTGVALVFVLFGGGVGESALDSLRWLAGCWEVVEGGRTVEEQWMQPRAGSMIGMGRTTAAGKRTFVEFLEIQETDSGMFYIARPGGRRPVSFKLVSRSEDRWVFENPLHDFPQRIIYTRLSDTAMVARTEGTVHGSVRGTDFDYRRVRCARE